MYEDTSIKAIFIGAGILVAIATISMIMSYYSIARNIAIKFVSGTTEIETLYRRDIESSMLKDTLTGTEVKNLVMYFQNNSLFEINIRNLKLSSTEIVVYNNINNDLTNYLKYVDNIRTEFLFSLQKTTSNNLTILTLTGLD
ncbi:MAG: hypothetical protein N2749_06995 [Clostridia bacterium]|nr:hypothetical protein [Clostridia bacterium]